MADRMEEKRTLSEHLSCLQEGLICPKDGYKKEAVVDRLKCAWESDADAYVELHHGAGIRLPSLDWNASFRKGYSLLAWIRPHLPTDQHDDDDDDDDDFATVGAKKESQVLYRFATSNQDDAAMGICATLAPWTADRDSSSSNTGATVLTSNIAFFTLPSYASSTIAARVSHQDSSFKNSSSFLSCPIRLQAGQWNLLCVRHVCPYLKSPQIHVTVNGISLWRGELGYPQLGESHHSPQMADVTCLTNVFGSKPIPFRDDNDSNKNTTSDTIRKCHLHVAAVALYPDLHLPMGSLAILAEAGPLLAQQCHGMILAPVPPIPNNRDAVITNHGNRKHPSNSSGRGLGIPLSIGLYHPNVTSHHGNSHDQHNSHHVNTAEHMAIQSGMGRAVVALSATDAIQVPLGKHHSTVIIPISHATSIGNTEVVAKMGLVQPGRPPVSTSDTTETNSRMAKCTGQATLHHATLDFIRTETKQNPLLHIQIPKDEHAERSLLPRMSTSLSCLNPLASMVLPFHLALRPPGHVYGLQQELYEESFMHLQQLLQNEGALAAKLISLLASSLKHSARMREEALQSGILFTLANLLRRVLIRGHRLGLLPSSNASRKTISRTTQEWKKRFGSMEAEPGTDDHSLSSLLDDRTKTYLPIVIPPKILESATEIVNACCGPVVNDLEETGIPPLVHVRRTSDLALTCLFGFCWGADGWDVWGASPAAADVMLEAVASRYGTVDWGWLLRGQLSVQQFVDLVRIRFGDQPIMPPKSPISSPSSIPHRPTHKKDDDERLKHLGNVAVHLASLVRSMLLASLSSPNAIQRGEADVTAVVLALSDCQLGSVGAAVLLLALRDVLIWTNILPSPPISNHDTSVEEDDEHAEGMRRLKLQVTNRLARNMLMSQFHDVVGPMILSRTVFSGITKYTQQIQENVPLELQWTYHWRISLFVFTWLASLSGPEGEIASRSTGNLLLASGLAGSLYGCLLEDHDDGGEHATHSQPGLIVNLFLPPPMPSFPDPSNPDGIWDNYATALSNRLRTIIPLLPGLVASLVSLPEGGVGFHDSSKAVERSGNLSRDAFSSVRILTDLIATVGASFQRVCGNAIIRASTSRRTKGRGSASSSSSYVKMAKEFIPSLITVAMLLDEAIHKWKELTNQEGNELSYFDVGSSVNERGPPKNRPIKEIISRRKYSDLDWIDVSSDVSDSTSVVNSSDTPSNPHATQNPSSAVLSRLVSCQDIVLRIKSELLFSAMNTGGGEASTIVWRSVVSSLSTYAGRSLEKGGMNSDSLESSEKQELRGTKSTENTLASEGTARSDKSSSGLQSVDLLCRLVVLTLGRIASQDDTVEMWSVELCSACARLCDLVEEKDLLKPNTIRLSSNESPELKPNETFSPGQVRLIFTLLDLMIRGREKMGWCQLVLPATPSKANGNAVSHDHNIGGAPSGSSRKLRATLNRLMDGAMLQDNYDLYNQMGVIKGPYPDGTSPTSTPTPADKRKSRGSETSSLQASSKLLLPILQPCLRLILNCLSAPLLDFTSRTNPMSGSGDENDLRQSGSGDQEYFEVSILKHVSSELKSTLTAAIVGLSFVNARDVALNAMALIRRALSNYRNINDAKGIEICSTLLSLTVEEIRIRYVDERRKRDMNVFDAYNDEATKDSETDKPNISDDDSEAKSSQAVERMILGGDLVPPKDDDVITNPEGILQDGTEKGDNAAAQHDASKSRRGNPGTRRENDDFILFHDNLPGSKSDDSGRSLGFSHYKGFYAALEKCRLKHDDSTKASSGPATSQDEGKPEMILSILAPYLDFWDESTARDAAESELVELFDESINMTDGGYKDTLGFSKGYRSAFSPSPSTEQSIPGSETAADSMSSFIELSSAEKIRLADIGSIQLSSQRCAIVAFSEKYCWSQFVEIDKRLDDGHLFERGIGDGKHVRGRMISIPIHPQFKRFIPAYLDHTVDSGLVAKSSPKDPYEEDDGIFASKKDTSTLTKSLIESGKIKIVDITKKEVIDEIDGSLDIDILDDEIIIEDDSLDPESDDSIVFPQTRRDKKMGQESSMSSIDDTVPSTTVEESFSTESAAFEGNKTSAPLQYHQNSFSRPPMSPLIGHISSNTSRNGLSAGGGHGEVEMYLDDCLHVKPDGSRKCTLFLTSTHLILEYDGTNGLFEGEELAIEEEEVRREAMQKDLKSCNSNSSDAGPESRDMKKIHLANAALRPRSMRWNLSEVSHVYLRRYRLRDSALELFLIPSGGSTFGGNGIFSPSLSMFIDFGPGYEGNIRRDDAANAIMRRTPPQTVKQWPERSGQFLHDQLNRLTRGWIEGRVTNFDYLLHLNVLSGRTYNDLCQYPVMPWVLSNYTSESIPDLKDRSNFRDLTMPMGALNPTRLKDYIDRFETFSDPTIPPFMYGSHYSTSAGVVLHFLVRLHPFADLHRQLQGGHFDVADRLFSSIPRTWSMCTGASAAEVKELTPEFYSNPMFLKNSNKFKLGSSQDGEVMGDVTLPPWADGSPEKFVEVMRDALESDICSEMLPGWIDLIFGRKQQGPEAIKAHNVFFYLTYYGSVDVASIEDEALRTATELQIAHFGQCPMQLFFRSHINKIVNGKNRQRLLFSHMLNLYEISRNERDLKNSEQNNEEDGLTESHKVLPFSSAPISHWVHLGVPLKTPPLVSVRLAGPDRIIAVDAQGIFHCFRWAWKPDQIVVDNWTDKDGTSEDDEEKVGIKKPEDFFDKGCFVAQRELPSFRSLPRLPYSPPAGGSSNDRVATVSMSKTLFAGRSSILVLSDGDGLGALAVQLVDPSKGTVKGELIVPSVHSCRVSSIAMDPIGTSAGQGGVGGELAIIGSDDGGASIWRFISSQYLPLRPRHRLAGHHGSAIVAVAVNSTLGVCSTVSRNKCCIHNVGNGTMLRSFTPPSIDKLDLPLIIAGESSRTETCFAETPALCLSIKGFIVLVCKSSIFSKDDILQHEVVTLQQFSLEGVHLGSRIIESYRGIPKKITATVDGAAVIVCCGRGVTIHKVSTIEPLEFIDEWQISEDDFDMDDLPAAFDIDFGPAMLRPVVAAAACSSGVLRLHALPGITEWSEAYAKGTVSQAVGTVLAKPAKKLKNVVGKGFGLGSRVVGLGKEIGREAMSDVKERGVGGFLGNVLRKNLAK